MERKDRHISRSVYTTPDSWCYANQGAYCRENYFEFKKSIYTLVVAFLLEGSINYNDFNLSMMNILTKDWKYSKDIGLFILRLVFGLVLIYGHGSEKLSTLFSGAEIKFMDPIGIGAHLSFYLAAFAEGICAILLILGLFGRFAAAVLAINFLVIFIFHAFMVGDGFMILEPRFFYLFSFVALVFTGPGRISLDQLIFNKSSNAVQ